MYPYDTPKSLPAIIYFPLILYLTDYRLIACAVKLLTPVVFAPTINCVIGYDVSLYASLLI
jgi:hypothetical protein